MARMGTGIFVYFWLPSIKASIADWMGKSWAGRQTARGSPQHHFAGVAGPLQFEGGSFSASPEPVVLHPAVRCQIAIAEAFAATGMSPFPKFLLTMPSG